jgi:hypothetical protein
MKGVLFLSSWHWWMNAIEIKWIITAQIILNNP